MSVRSGLARVLVAEFLGTAVLLLAVVGSGIATAGDASAPAQLVRHAVVVGGVLAGLVVVFLPVAGAIFSTSSMCFANPAVTIARAVTDSWTAIRPSHVPMYVIAQLVGLVLAVPLARWLVPIATPIRQAATTTAR